MISENFEKTFSKSYAVDIAWVFAHIDIITKNRMDAS